MSQGVYRMSLSSPAPYSFNHDVSTAATLSRTTRNSVFFLSPSVRVARRPVTEIARLRANSNPVDRMAPEFGIIMARE